jgi:signal transduction histidine kinase
MATREELRSIPVFNDLTDEQLDWFLSQSKELVVEPGQVHFSAGDPAENMFVYLEGEGIARDPTDPNFPTFTAKAGLVTGTLPFSRMKQYGLTGRAITRMRVLHFPVDLFPALYKQMPELFKRLVGLMSDRIREVTRMEQQQDRLAALGKLSAGLAHELNNPAAAARRAAEKVREAVIRSRFSTRALATVKLTNEQVDALEEFENSLIKPETPVDGLAASDLEQEIEQTLESKGIENGWRYSAPLVEQGASPENLDRLLKALDPSIANSALDRVVNFIEINNLLSELDNSTSKISDLVMAVKEYSYMDQGPIQDVDVRKALENTLTIMNYKLKHGVTVIRDYYPEPLLVNSYGSELNQVWTNIIDNAIDAMNGKGELIIRTLPEADCLLVEIIDNGPGMSSDVESHIFEPFFTTKGVGEGTGLGLDTALRIVRKHRGTIVVDSVPGRTRFQIRLPLTPASVPQE